MDKYYSRDNKSLFSNLHKAAILILKTLAIFYITNADFGQAIRTFFGLLFSKKSEFRPSPTNSDHNWGHCIMGEHLKSLLGISSSFRRQYMIPCFRAIRSMHRCMTTIGVKCPPLSHFVLEILHFVV